MEDLLRQDILNIEEQGISLLSASPQSTLSWLQPPLPNASIMIATGGYGLSRGVQVTLGMEGRTLSKFLKM